MQTCTPTRLGALTVAVSMPTWVPEALMWHQSHIAGHRGACAAVGVEGDAGGRAVGNGEDEVHAAAGGVHPGDVVADDEGELQVHESSTTLRSLGRKVARTAASESSLNMRQPFSQKSFESEGPVPSALPPPCPSLRSRAKAEVRHGFHCQERCGERAGLALVAGGGSRRGGGAVRRPRGGDAWDESPLPGGDLRRVQRRRWPVRHDVGRAERSRRVELGLDVLRGAGGRRRWSARRWRGPASPAWSSC